MRPAGTSCGLASLSPSHTPIVPAGPMRLLLWTTSSSQTGASVRAVAVDALHDATVSFVDETGSPFRSVTAPEGIVGQPQRCGETGGRQIGLRDLISRR